MNGPTPDPDKRLLRWLASPTSEQQSENAEDDALRRALLRGAVPKDWVTVLLPVNRKALREDWEDAHRLAPAWYDRRFPVAEVEAWLKAGLAPDEPALAVALVDEGITPLKAGTQFQHWTTGELTTVIHVARTWRAAYGSLSKALDDAGVERTRRTDSSRGLWVDRLA